MPNCEKCGGATEYDYAPDGLAGRDVCQTCGHKNAALICPDCHGNGDTLNRRGNGTCRCTKCKGRGELTAQQVSYKAMHRKAMRSAPAPAPVRLSQEELRARVGLPPRRPQTSTFLDDELRAFMAEEDKSKPH